MKKLTQSILLAGIAVILFAFTPKNETSFVGTCGVSPSNSSQITLRIFANQTYYYQDFSVPNQKIISRGRWFQAGNTLTLQVENAQKNFHRVWKFSLEGKLAKSRKGLCFYSLCRPVGKKIIWLNGKPLNIFLELTPPHTS
jgi:hypothetical protein